MSHPLRPVARGLGLARFGLWLTVVCVALLAAESLAVEPLKLADFMRQNRWAGQVYGWVMTLTGLAAFAGCVVAFVGRCFCLATPDGMPVARTRIRFAVILEACGWLSGLANVFVGYAVALRVIPMPIIVSAVTGVFSLLLLVAGRVMFLRFTCSLAGSFHPPLARQSMFSLNLLAVLVACVATSFGLYQLANFSVAPPSLAFAMSGGFGFTAGVLGIAGLFVYGRLLRRLRDAVTRPNPLVAHEPDPPEPSTPPEFALVAQ